MDSMLVEEVVRSKPCNHSQSAKHSEIKKGCCRKRSCQEHDHTFRSCLMEALDALKMEFAAVMDCRYFHV